MDETQGSCWKVKHLVIWTQTFNMTTPCQVKRKWKLVIVAEIVQDSSTRTWNRRGEKIGSEESSIRTWNRREKFTGSEESSRKVYRVRGFVDQEWKSSRKIYRVRGIVDQDEESSTGSEDLSTRSETSSTGSEDSSTRSETSSTGSKYLIFFWNRCLLRHFNVCWCQEGKGL